jgi:hypothetical protein
MKNVKRQGRSVKLVSRNVVVTGQAVSEGSVRVSTLAARPASNR